MSLTAELTAEQRIRFLVDVAPTAAEQLGRVGIGDDGGNINPLDLLEALLAAAGVPDEVARIGTVLTRRRAASWALSADDDDGAALGVYHLAYALEKANR